MRWVDGGHVYENAAAAICQSLLIGRGECAASQAPSSGAELVAGGAGAGGRVTGDTTQ